MADRSENAPRGVGALAGVLALVAASLVATAVALEVGLRIAVPHWRDLVAQRFMTATDDGVLAGVPRFDGRTASLFGEFDVPVQLDERGFRNAAGSTPDAPLAFVGDSFCFGWGVLPAEGFAPQVADRLGVPAYNYCIVGADLADYLRVMRHWMPRDRTGPTVLTVTFENDVLAYPPAAGDDAPSATVQALGRAGWSAFLMTHSALFNVGTTLARMNPTIVGLVRRLGLMSGASVTATGGVDPIEASVRLIERIRQQAGAGPFLVLAVPPRAGQIGLADFDAFVAALRRAGLDVLDPREVPNLTITTIPRDGHWDAAMHAAIAPVIAARLRQAGAR